MTVLYIIVFGLAAFVSVLFAELKNTTEKAAEMAIELNAAGIVFEELEKRVAALEADYDRRQGDGR